MSLRSKKRRKQRRAVEGIGLIAKGINKENQDASNPGQKNSPPKSDWNKYLGIGALISFILGVLAVAANGVFNFFSDQPIIQLFPFSVALCLLIFLGTHKLVIERKRSRLLHAISALLCAFILWETFKVVLVKKMQQSQEAVDRKQERQNMAQIASAMPLLTNKTAPSAALNVLAKELQSTADQLSQASNNAANMAQLEQFFSNQWQQSQLQLSDAQKTLAEVRTATQPRRITPEQREKFIKILSNVHNISKIPIRVIVGKSDSETENFALQVREMLDQAGYGIASSGLQSPLTDPPNNENVLYPSVELPDIKIPPYKTDGIYKEIVRIPNYFFSTPAVKDVEVIGVFAVAPDFKPPSNTPSVMVYYATNNTFRSKTGYKMMISNNTNQFRGTLYTYHPTQNPNSIVIGVMQALDGAGISTWPVVDNKLLKPGDVAFFIPQKFY